MKLEFYPVVYCFGEVFLPSEILSFGLNDTEYESFMDYWRAKGDEGMVLVAYPNSERLFPIVALAQIVGLDDFGGKRIHLALIGRAKMGAITEYLSLFWAQCRQISENNVFGSEYMDLLVSIYDELVDILTGPQFKFDINIQSVANELKERLVFARDFFVYFVLSFFDIMPGYKYNILQIIDKKRQAEMTLALLQTIKIAYDMTSINAIALEAIKKEQKRSQLILVKRAILGELKKIYQDELAQMEEQRQ